MTRKRRRLYLVLAGMSALAVAAALVLSALRDNIVFFYSPTEVVQKQLPLERRFRIGGLVQPGSVEKAGLTTRFEVSDGETRLQVRFSGMLPDLFREGQGVVAEGRLVQQGWFEASQVLAKHDEKYMPPEVADALKKSGHWNPGSGDGAAGKPPDSQKPPGR